MYDSAKRAYILPLFLLSPFMYSVVVTLRTGAINLQYNICLLFFEHLFYLKEPLVKPVYVAVILCKGTRRNWLFPVGISGREGTPF